jgi:hypothetical protein
MAEMKEEEKIRNMRERERRTYFRKQEQAVAEERAAKWRAKHPEAADGDATASGAVNDGGDAIGAIEGAGGARDDASLTRDSSTTSADGVDSAKEPEGVDSLDWEADMSDSEAEEEHDAKP